MLKCVFLWTSSFKGSKKNNGRSQLRSQFAPHDVGISMSFSNIFKPSETYSLTGGFSKGSVGLACFRCLLEAIFLPRVGQTLPPSTHWNLFQPGKRIQKALRGGKNLEVPNWNSVGVAPLQSWALRLSRGVYCGEASLSQKVMAP